MTTRIVIFTKDVDGISIMDILETARPTSANAKTVYHIAYGMIRAYTRDCPDCKFWAEILDINVWGQEALRGFIGSKS